MFGPVTKNIFRWGTIDPESGIMMHAHLIIDDEKCVLIDPVAMPGIVQMIKILADLVALIITNYQHLRGDQYYPRNLMFHYLFLI